jgi:phosphohistidine phosphatase SixA
MATASLANDWDALDQPGAVAIMRHALAPGTGDPSNFTLGECSTQRNLDARGRAQARAIGQAMRERGHSFDRILSSQWCRTMETANLLDLGEVQEIPALNSFFQDRSTRDAQTDAIRDTLMTTDEKVFLVTHFVNISALTGESTGSGEVLIIRALNGKIEVLGRIDIAP